MTKDIYRNRILEKIPYLLSFQDRNPFSITYGCFDRNYWQWKFVDFSCPRLQEGVCALALLYLNNFEGNICFQQPKIKEWIEAGMKFWRQRQHSDGSFDEAYPNEHSFAATAFSAFYISEAYISFKNELKEDFKQELIKDLERAAIWLTENDETHGFLANHQAAATAALYNIYLITGNEKYKNRAEYFLNKIKKKQNLKEGWLEEYGGADPGYQTHANFYLAKYWQLSKSDVALGILKKSVDFLSYCIHPNATLGGEYGSRNTEFYFPAGFEIIKQEIPKAGFVAKKMLESICKNESVGLTTVDIYNFFPMLNNYIFAFLTKTKEIGNIEKDLFSNHFTKFFSEAGIFIKNTPHYYLIIGTSKGGVIRIYDTISKKLIYSDCGYIGKLDNGKTVTSQWLNRQRSVKLEGDSIKIFGSFYGVPQKVFSPRLFIVFRIIMTIVGKIKIARYFIKNVLVKTLIRQEKKYQVNFMREIRLEENKIYIIDKINKSAYLKFSSLYLKDKFVTIHMGSSKYFQKQELENEFLAKENLAEEINNKKEIINKKVISTN